MCWADKIAAVWAFVVVGIVVALQKPGGFVQSIDTEAGLGQWLRLFFVIILPVWAFLRVIDWASGGPDRRRGSVRAHLLQSTRRQS